MFQFSGFAHILCDMSSTCRVAPFGNPRIKSYVLIPVAYRSLSRPSSPLRAKASTVCPYLLTSPHTLLILYADAFISVESPLVSGMLPLRIAHLPFQGKTTSLLLSSLKFFSSNMSKNVPVMLYSGKRRIRPVPGINNPRWRISESNR